MTRYLSENGKWETVASGDVVGPASSTDNAIARFDGTTGKLLQNSSATVSDTGTFAVARLSLGSGPLGLDPVNINNTEWLKRDGTDIISAPISGDLDAVARVGVCDDYDINGIAGQRRNINFIEGTGISITVTDDGANEKVDVEIAASGAGVPIGAIIPAYLSAGDITTYFTGGLGNAGQRWDHYAICDGNNGTPNLAGKFPRFSTSAAGGTGGADTNSHTHSVTSNVTVGDHAAHTHSVTSNVTVGDHSSHTHDYTQVLNHTHTVSITDPGHTHTQNVNSSSAGGLSGYTADTSTSGSIASGYSTASATTGITASTANPGGGVATGTTAGPSATLTHSVTNNAVTSGNPSATLTHGVTNNAVTSGAASDTENRPAYYELVPVMRVS